MFAVKDDVLMVGLSDLDFIKLSGIISSVFKCSVWGEGRGLPSRINLWRLKESYLCEVVASEERYVDLRGGPVTETQSSQCKGTWVRSLGRELGTTCGQ